MMEATTIWGMDTMRMRGKLIAISLVSLFVIVLTLGTFVLAQSVHSNTLIWPAVPNVNNYNVYKAPASCTGAFTKLTTTPISVTTFVDTGMVDGEVNCYYVTSIASTGAESVRSNEQLATTPTNFSGPVSVPPPVLSLKGSN